jgi:hypothetical protein
MNELQSKQRRQAAVFTLPAGIDVDECISDFISIMYFTFIANSISFTASSSSPWVPSSTISTFTARELEEEKRRKKTGFSILVKNHHQSRPLTLNVWK